MSTSEIVHVPPQSLLPALSMEEVAERRNAVVEFTRAALHEGVDFGVIPNTSKPTLLKPGAEKLCTLFGLSPTFEILDSVKDWTGAEHGGEPLFYFEYKCKLWKNGVLIAEGDGSCNSWEKKYRFREAKRLCPDCGQPTIIKGRKEFGGGWLCFKKQGGCGAKFFDGDTAIEAQEVGQVPNPDAPDLINTIQKMSQKRALIAATLIAVNASEFFTQDLEEMIIEGTFTVQPAPRPDPGAAPRFDSLMAPRAERGEASPAPVVTSPDTSLLIAELRAVRKNLHAAGGSLRELTIGQMKVWSVDELEHEITRTRAALEELRLKAA